ncbi:MAG TPA: hypothetical protein VNT04_07090 [Gaiellaceae bacterium]|jgi:hypothetical protein|nr:hypothetical protein [Gaiellaceae bacterium]
MAALSVRAAASWNAEIGMTSHVAIVVTVNRGTGEPVTGLQASSFHVFDAGGHGGIEDSRPIASFEAFREHQTTGAHGAYTIGLGGGFVGQMPIIIVDVTSGADRGRAMTQVRFR